jgi:hypothetical protein
MALYYKIAATLKLQGDIEGLRFVQNLKPHIQAGRLSMVSVLIQLDQHDFAVRNRLTMAEHRYNLDVPAWEDRPKAEQQQEQGDGMAAQVAAAVR